MKFSTKRYTPKQWQKKQLADARYDGFKAACKAVRRVFGARQHKAIRDVVHAVEHVQGDRASMRLFRSKLRLKVTTVKPR